METIEQYLSKYKEKTPSWLNAYKKGNKITLNLLLSSRTFFYPGALLDGTPIKILNSAEYCHIFIYVDNGVLKKEVEIELNNFKGYILLDKLNFIDYIKGEFAILAIYEKLPSCNFKGANRFALLYIKDDGLEVYKRIYHFNVQPSIVLAENYMGDNAQFGLGSQLEKVANRAPSFLLTNGNPWELYEKVPAHGFTYGDEGHKRYLYKYSNEKFVEKFHKEHKELMDALAK